MSASHPGQEGGRGEGGGGLKQAIILVETWAKFPHSPILHYACRSLLTENNVKNNTTRCGTKRFFFCCFLVAKQRTTYIEPHA